jgi:hypothetical protein
MVDEAKQVSNQCNNFSLFNLFQDNLAFFSAGMIAEAVSCVFWLPIDIIKERLQVQNVMKTGYGYKNSFDAYRKIV